MGDRAGSRLPQKRHGALGQSWRKRMLLHTPISVPPHVLARVLASFWVTASCLATQDSTR
eukprot:12071795-Ditylum_brightwellii.AAC.3